MFVFFFKIKFKNNLAFFPRTKGTFIMYNQQKLSHPTNRAYKNLRWIQLGISGYFFFNPFPSKLYFFWHVWCFNASLDFLQDNQMRLSGRVTQYLIDKFEDNRGIDCERLYRFLTDAHLKSGQSWDSSPISNPRFL